MKKRLVCLLLCLVTVLSLVLASCSSKSEDDAKTDISENASESAITLTMWLVSEEKVSDETAAAVTKALNSITESKFKTRLVLNYFTEDEYRAKVESTILAYEEAKKNKVTVETETTVDTSEETGVVTDETETNEYGMSVIKYPEVFANQVDIIYITGEDMYIDFIDNEWLAELDTELSSSSKKIKEYVSNTLLSAAKYDGTTYAIPNNRVIGEYTYMLLNKELMQKYSQQGYVELGMIDGFYNENLYTFLNMIYMFEPDVVPIDSTYEECLDMLAHYWSIDPESYDMLNEFSILGSHYTDLASLSRGSVVLGFDSLFADDDFTDSYLQLNKFKFGTEGGRGSYFGDATGKTAAVKFVTGDSTVLTYNEEQQTYEYVETVNGEKVTYYPVVAKYPTASSEDIYGNMFGVCKYTEDVGRCMDIVEYLNTNATFRNILQYGIENTNYKLDENSDGTVTLRRLNNDYMMDIYSTGNVFIAYPEPDMSADIWESGKVQNRYSLVDPLLGLDFSEYAGTTGEEEESVTIPKDPGYIVNASSGYSKDVLGQNATLAAWFKECDAAGQGIYVLKTSVIEGQNLTVNYYVYNNNITKNVTFSVEDIRVMETPEPEEGSDKTPDPVQTDLDFVLTYTDASGNSKTGYELSVVTLLTKKTNAYELKCKVGETETAIQTKELNTLLTFDFLNTEEYSIDVYDNMTKPAFLKNNAVYGWISSVDTKSYRVPTSFVMNYKGESVNGKTEYVYVIYCPGLQDATSLEILPTGNSGELNLIANYKFNEGDGLGEEDLKYVLAYVHVTADSDTKVSFKLTSNGATTDYTATEVTEDPDFTLLGNLDTELVKYMYQLNQDVVAVLDACKSYKELEAVVNELKIFLGTGEFAPSLSEFTVLKELVEKYKKNESLATLHKYLLAAVSYEPIIEYEEGEDGEQVESTLNGESYVYYDSAYGIYYAWLETYGFLPAAK